MSGMLLDGTVLPSYLEEGEEEVAGAMGSLSDTTLRVGEVVAAYSPTDPKNKGSTRGKQWVYVVNVLHRDGVGSIAVVPYRCTTSDLFGGLGDHLRYTVRRRDTGNQTQTLTKGAQVLVLCPNGDRSNALILGGVRHPDEKTADPSGTFFSFVFNGVTLNIDKDGALSLLVPGATKLDGSPADGRDSSNKGTRVDIRKDGTVEVNDQNGDSITISPKNKGIVVKAGTVSVEAENVYLGGDETTINPLDGVVVGTGVDTFTGVPYAALGNTSKGVKAKK